MRNYVAYSRVSTKAQGQSGLRGAPGVAWLPHPSQLPVSLK
ncbi:hypothetical protein [Pontibacter saemangeumensis]